MMSTTTLSTSPSSANVAWLSFSGISKYAVGALCVFLIVLLFRGRSKVQQLWFAVWISEVFLSIGIVCAVSGIGVDFFPNENSPLIGAVLPSTMSLATLGLWSVSGALLTPSSTSRCTCGACSLHPRWITVIIGVILLVLNVVAAFAVAIPTPIISLYFGFPAVVVLLVVLSLRTVVAQTVDSKVGSIAMLGGISIIVVGAVVLLILSLEFGCGVYYVRQTTGKCPLPNYFDAESVFMCFLAVGLIFVWLGAQRLACEPLDSARTRLINERKYFR